jgi:uncharacterized protein (DUF952 family)
VERAPARIYHIVTAADLREHTRDETYRPPSLATEGCVHCALAGSVLAVANDYYATAAPPVMLLEIDPTMLTSVTRYEAAAPLAGGGTTHLLDSPVFPHVYGPLELRAVTGEAELQRGEAGFAWPPTLASLETVVRDAAIDEDRRGKTAVRKSTIVTE